MGRLGIARCAPGSRGYTLESMKEAVERGRRRLGDHRDRLAYFEAMAAKYERAARYPWLPVADSDPPEPNRSGGDRYLSDNERDARPAEGG